MLITLVTCLTFKNFSCDRLGDRSDTWSCVFAMKILFILIYWMSFALAKRTKPDVNIAINSVIDNIKSTKTIDVISIGQDDIFFDHVIRNLLKRHFDTSFQVIKFKEADVVKHFINKFTIVLISSMHLLKKINGFNRALVFTPIQSSILIVCPGLTVRLLRSIYDKLEHRQLTSYLVYEEGIWELLIIFRDFSRYEKAKILRRINYLDGSTNRWNGDLFFPESRSDFQGFRFKFEIAHNSRQRIIKTKNKRGELINGFYGVNIKIIRLIGSILNFRPQFISEKQEKLKKGRMDEIIKFRYRPINVYRNHNNKFYIGMVYENSPLKYVVPLGETYTGYEKLVLAFDRDTWICIIVTFLISFLTIFITSFMSRRIQGIVFGSRVTTPSLNVIVAFFGLGQMTLPRRSFARFLLMCFILYSLIIRTAYQGVSFDILQKDVRKLPIQTKEEAIAKGYSFTSGNTFRDYWKHVKIGTKVQIGNVSNSLYGIHANSSAREVCIANDNEILRFDVRNKGVKNYHILKEIFVVQSLAIGFEKNHSLFEPFNNQLKKLIETGIVKHYIEMDNEQNKKYLIKQTDGPKVLTVTTLSAGFKVWLYSLLVSTTVFVIEVSYFNHRKLLELFLSPFIHVLTRILLSEVLRKMREF